MSPKILSENKVVWVSFGAVLGVDELHAQSVEGNRAESAPVCACRPCGGDGQKDVLTAAEVSEIEDNVEKGFAGHPMGTCRMGNDPETSVVGPNLRAHEVPNLFVVGSSVFVTGSSLQPSLMIAALAIRAARSISHEVTPSSGFVALSSFSGPTPVGLACLGKGCSELDGHAPVCQDLDDHLSVLCSVLLGRVVLPGVFPSLA